MSASQPARRRPELADFSDAVQDYLREIFKLQSEGSPVKTSTLARRMGVSAPSATAMVKKLAALGLAEHRPYRGVRLTPAGERIALEVIRHHRLLELFLTETLDVGVDAVHAEADRLEHALSEELEARIDAMLGSPAHDPHGDPIPDANLGVVPSTSRPLAALAPGDEAVVERVPDGDGELLRYLATVSLLPRERVEVLHVAPFGGPLTIRVGGREVAISHQLAARIDVCG
jgi:DtxR family transcriptional regulator, Mn-dependent transcriptional regulator